MITQDYLDYDFYRYEATKDVLIVKGAPTHIIRSNTETLNMFIRLLKKLNCNNALIDFSETHLSYAPRESYGKPEQYDEPGIERNYNIAMVVNNINEELAFFDFIHQSNGYNIKVFESFDDAFSWLEEIQLKTDC